jgi:demethoxyubiquinone hydroxylase (CLK1/Coq7/Cat5 family)
VARHYRDAVDTLRKQEVKRLRKALPQEQHDELKHILWPLRKQSAELTEEAKADGLRRIRVQRRRG